jgi:hypothetical protein
MYSTKIRNVTINLGKGEERILKNKEERICIVMDLMKSL